MRQQSLGLWVACALANLLFSGSAAAASADERPADVKPSEQARPAIAKTPDAAQERERLVDQLIAEYRNPPAPPQPSAEQQAEIEKVIQRFGAEDFAVRAAASTAARKLGRGALAVLRKATADPDPEVARLVRKAMEEIESAARKDAIARIKAAPDCAEILERKMAATQRAWASLALEVPAAQTKDDQAAVARLQAEIAVLDGFLGVLRAIRDEPAPTHDNSAASASPSQASGKY